MPNLSKPTALGLLSTAALLLGACSYTAPGYSSGASYSSAAHSTHYSAPVTRTYTASTPYTRTTYAPRTVYAATPTTISHSAPYGSAVYGRRAPSHHGTGLRPAGYTYGSVGAVLYDIDQEAVGLQGRLGYQATPVLGAEIEGSFGIMDDDTTVGLVTTETDYDYSVGGFATARVPVSRQLSLHARGGYHATRVERTVGLLSASNTADGLAYGAGAELAMNPRDSIRLDYTLYEVPGANLDAVSLGYQRKF